MAASSFIACPPSLDLSLGRCSSSSFPASLRVVSSIPFGISRQVISISKFRKGGSLSLVRATTEQAVNHQTEKVETDDEVCELVSRLELTLGEGENAIDAYLVKAMKNNNGAAVLLLTDVYGYNNNDIRDFAYRLSCFGYNVLVPDLFRGMPWNKEIPKDKYEEWRTKHPPERVHKDIDMAASWLLEEIAAAGVTKKLGLVGFCFGGGRIIETLARDAGERFATAVSFYPTRFNPALVPEIKVPVLLITGDKDELCNANDLQKIAGHIEGSQALIYAGRAHAFAHRPASLEEDEDAENSFSAMKSWLHEKLLSHK